MRRRPFRRLYVVPMTVAAVGLSLLGIVTTAGAAGVSGATEVSLPANADASPQFDLSSISCPATGDCSALGSYTTTSGTSDAAVLAESSGVWGQPSDISLPNDAAFDPKPRPAALAAPAWVIARWSAATWLLQEYGSRLRPLRPAIPGATQSHWPLPPILLAPMAQR